MSSIHSGVAAVVGDMHEPANVLGHSYGALIVLEAALLTDQIRRLVLYEPLVPTGQPQIAPAIVERMERLVDRGELEAALEVMMRQVVEMPDHEFEAYRRLPMWQVRIALAPTIPRELATERTYRFDPERVADLRVPTMLLLGGDSQPRVRQDTERVDAALPNSRIVVMPDQQHIAMDMDPELFTSEVVRFLLDRGGTERDAQPGLPCVTDRAILIQV